MSEHKADHYINQDGNFVFTAAYHLRRGYCCKNECKHCPWGYKKDKTNEKENQKAKK